MMPAADAPTGFATLAARTPALVGVGRAGPRPRTSTLVALRVARAAAADALVRVMPAGMAKRLRAVELATTAAARIECIRDPRRATRLAVAARARLRRCRQRPDVQIVLCDGLAPTALAAHGPALVRHLTRRLRSRGHRLGTVVLVRNGRAAVGHEIGRGLRPRVLCLVAGQRPSVRHAEAVTAEVVPYRSGRPTATPAVVLRDLTRAGATTAAHALADAIDGLLAVPPPAAARPQRRRRVTPSRARGGRRGSRSRA